MRCPFSIRVVWAICGSKLFRFCTAGLAKRIHLRYTERAETSLETDRGHENEEIRDIQA
jgi:hypothetical protein